MYTAEQLELPEQLEMADVVSEANRLLKRVPDLADAGEFSERTIHYYVHKKLLPRRTGRGPGTTYAPGFVYRLLLIRLLQKDGLSLDEISARYRVADVNHLPDADIADVLLGKRGLDTRVRDDDEFSAAPAAFAPAPSIFQRSDSTRLASGAPKAHAKPDTAKPVAASDRRGWRLRRRVKKSSVETIPPSSVTEAEADFDAPGEPLALEASDAPAVWDATGEEPSVSYPLGPDAELVLHKELTPSQQRRIEHIVELMKDILDDTD